MKLNKIVSLFIASLMITACTPNKKVVRNSNSESKISSKDNQSSIDESKSKTTESLSTSKSSDETNIESDEKTLSGTIQGRSTLSTTNESKAQTNSNVDETTTRSEHVTDSDEVDPLAGYSDLEIEYARIWIQLGPNPDVEKLYVQVFPKGTPINPNLEGSAVYPEDVTQISGSRLVDGVITYSSNGDGTINVYYQVPKRFEIPSEDIPEEVHVEETFDMARNINTVYIDPSDPDTVISYIEKIQ